VPFPLLLWLWITSYLYPSTTVLVLDHSLRLLMILSSTVRSGMSVRSSAAEEPNLVSTSYYMKHMELREQDIKSYQEMCIRMLYTHLNAFFAVFPMSLVFMFQVEVF
jgi:hypothetical protein